MKGIKIIILSLLVIGIFVLVNMNIKFSRLLLIILIGLSIYLGMSIKQLKNSGKQEGEVKTSSLKNPVEEFE